MFIFFLALNKTSEKRVFYKELTCRKLFFDSMLFSLKTYAKKSFIVSKLFFNQKLFHFFYQNVKYDGLFPGSSIFKCIL